MNLITKENEYYKEFSVIYKTKEDAEEFKKEYIRFRKSIYSTKKFYLPNELMETIEKNIDKKELEKVFKEPKNKTKISI